MSSQTDAEKIIDKGMRCLKLLDSPLFNYMLGYLKEHLECMAIDNVSLSGKVRMLLEELWHCVETSSKTQENLFIDGNHFCCLSKILHC